MTVHRFLVAGTDTGVGKTEVACALAALLAERQERPWVFKPYESGMEQSNVPADAQALRQAAGNWQSLDTVCLYRYRAPLSPAVAAKLERRPASFRRVLRTLHQAEGASMVVEGAGGLLSPLDGQHTIADIAQALRLPVLLVARNALGTLNHTALCLEALRHRRIKVAAVLLSQSAAQADISQKTNHRWLSQTFTNVTFLPPMPFIDAHQKRLTALKRVLSRLM
ncbi:MAG: dethiobiotin synthase [Myxococcaceae bacterium]|nr:dethiobiotin synthase [Myxococcaceae bacterium]